MKINNREELKAKLMNAPITQQEISEITGMSKQTINDIIWGRNGNKKLITRVVNLIGFDFTRYHN